MVGFVLCLIIFFIIIKEAVFQKRYLKANLNYNYVIPFIIIFMVEIFPVKTSGSFFTTGTSSYFFLILAITVGLNNKLKSN